MPVTINLKPTGKNKLRPAGRGRIAAPVAPPLIDLLGDFSEQTGALFG